VIQTDRTQLSTATGSYILSPNAPTGGVDAINEFQQGLRGILQADNIDDSSWVRNAVSSIVWLKAIPASPHST
jgi:hypothetical protein